MSRLPSEAGRFAAIAGIDTNTGGLIRRSLAAAIGQTAETAVIAYTDRSAGLQNTPMETCVAADSRTEHCLRPRLRTHHLRAVIIRL